MSTEQLTLGRVPGRRILRLYNLYRVIIGLALVLLISSDLDDQLLELAHAQLFRYGSWTYLILNVLIAVLLQRPSHLAQVFSLALLDVLLLCALFFAAGGTPSGIGNLLIVAVAIANILLRGRIGLLIAAVAASAASAQIPCYSPQLGANLGLGDEQMSAAQPLGFAFPFGGATYTAVQVGDNGYVSLGASGGVAAWNPTAQRLVTEMGAQGPADMGRVMAAAKARLAGKADLGVLSAAVKKALHP